MDTKPSFSLLDHFRKAFTLGIHRLELAQLTLEKGQTQKKLDRAIGDLGRVAWDHGVSHPRFESFFTQLSELDQKLNEVVSVRNELKRNLEQARTQGEAMAAEVDADPERRKDFIERSKLLEKDLAENELKHTDLRKSLDKLTAELGREVADERPEAPPLNENYARIDELIHHQDRLEHQIGELQERIATTGTTTRRILYASLVLVGFMMFLFSALVYQNFFVNNGPVSVALRFVEAIADGNHLKAISLVHFGSSLNEDEETFLVLLFPEILKRASQEHGGLKGAVVLGEKRIDADTSEVWLAWRYKEEDLAGKIILKKIEGQWKVGEPDFGTIEGKLRGAKFISEKPLPQPIPGVVPGGFHLNLRLKDGEGMASVKADLDGEQVQVFQNGNVTFTNTPFGKHTLHITASGFKNRKMTIKATVDDFPEFVDVELGDPEPLDPNNTFLLGQGGGYQLAQFTPEGISYLWKEQQNFNQIKGWNDDKTSLYFVNFQGSGKIDVAGRIEWQWQVTQSAGPSRNSYSQFAFRPDYKEIAFIRNNDLFTQAIENGQELQRWTQNGLHGVVLGWFDNETVLTSGSRDQVNNSFVVHRDGSHSVFHENARGGTPILDNQNRMAFLYQNGHFYIRDNGKSKSVAKINNSYNRHQSNSWTSDNDYHIFVINDYRNSKNGIIALSRQGELNQVLPSLLPNNNQKLQALVMAPAGSKFAVAWRGQDHNGIYLADATKSNSGKRINSLAVERLFWLEPDKLIYVVPSGDELGTWITSIGSGDARKLFSYRADNATLTPDGRLLLVANQTLWITQDKGDPKMLGKEGSVALDANAHFLWPSQTLN